MTSINSDFEIPGPVAQSVVQRDRRVVMPCAGRAYPFVLDRGLGCEVWDVDGNRFLDMTAGIAVLAAGHSHPRIVRAIQQQVERFTHLAGTDFYSESMVRLCETLAATFPPPWQWQIFLCNSGTESIEGAIKLARHASRRHAIISFFGAFHGRSYGSMSATTSHSRQRDGHYPLLPGLYHAFFADPYRPPFGVAPGEVTSACLRYIEHVIFGRLVPPDEVAAILIEPIQGEGGYIVPAPGFLRGLREICDRHGILLVFDEVQCGVARTGRMWAYEHEEVIPDIVTSAKGLGGGLPIGAIVAKAGIAERWSAGSHGSTYSGNGIVCAAALEVLALAREELIDNAHVVGALLRSELERLQEKYPEIGAVRGRGLMIGVDLVKSRPSAVPDRVLAHEVVLHAFRRGMLLLTCGESTVRFCPPLILTTQQAYEAVERFELALRLARES